MTTYTKTPFSLDIALEHLRCCRASGISDAEILRSIGAELPATRITTAHVLGALEAAWLGLIIHPETPPPPKVSPRRRLASAKR